MRLLRDCCVALTLACFAGCTTLQPIEEFSPSTIREEVAVGDRVSIVATNGVTYEFEVTAVEADALRGVSRSGKHYKVMFEAIRTIRAEQVHAGHTAGSIGATIGVIAAVFGALAFYAFVTMFDDD
jgi:hypothetical protein